MKAFQLVVLAGLIVLMAQASHGVASAAGLAGPCSPGAVYDPMCDVDHDGDVDVTDIQLTAGHWGQNGVWTAGDYSALCPLIRLLLPPGSVILSGRMFSGGV